MRASFQMSTFRTWSSLVFPLAHRSMRISVVCNFLSSFFLTAQHSAPYTMAGFIAVLHTLSFYCESNEARVMSGVPQGTVLGPLMFLTYINDITCGINGQMRLFADDALLYYPVRTIENGASLQHDLHTLHRWSKSWKMAFNGKKCHVMHVTRNITITSCSYTLGQDKLTPVSHHTYLGVELDDHLNWKEQTERARSKGVRMRNMIRRNFTRGTTPMIRCEVSVIYEKLLSIHQRQPATTLIAASELTALSSPLYCAACCRV